ncbi:putative dnaJ -like protein subfamily C member 2-like [Capsicum annuum]|uniref:Uncharacterized protein n=1 Tax=Capsicum annuum TaxID=4072 RepID=A0A2G3A283_CAPAN|nr:putative dnaJ -like protein subfamily C member 2-like [Capsicum annuum]PHT88332.1 hypothetical protein T459_10438 [Capsicum annuum]
MRGRSFSLNPLEEERGFHQLCVEPPLLQEDIPPNDEGWLYPGCDFKVDCIDLVNDSQGTDLSVTDNWEKVYPKEAVVAALGEKLDDIYGLPSDDSEDDNYNPENPDVKKKQIRSRGRNFQTCFYQQVYLPLSGKMKEIAGNDRVISPTDVQVNEQDLTAKRLAEVKSHLQELQSETNLRLQRVNSYMRQRSLAFHIIEPTEVEVERLSALKTNKLKELIFKRQNELEEIYRSVHMDVDSETACQILIHLMESGSDLSGLLSSMDDQVVKAKEEAASRKDVPDKMEKWKHASQEKSWLDKYGKDENRYNTGKDVHINLKRTKKARILVSKIPSLVENLTAKMKAWEK